MTTPTNPMELLNMIPGMGQMMERMPPAKQQKMGGANRPDPLAQYGLNPLDKVPGPQGGFNQMIDPTARQQLLQAMLERSKGGAAPPAAAPQPMAPGGGMQIR